MLSSIDLDHKPRQIKLTNFSFKSDWAKVAAYVPPMGRIRSSRSSTNIFDCLNFCLGRSFGFSI